MLYVLLKEGSSRFGGSVAPTVSFAGVLAFVGVSARVTSGFGTLSGLAPFVDLPRFWSDVCVPGAEVSISIESGRALLLFAGTETGVVGRCFAWAPGLDLGSLTSELLVGSG